jgi:hypothetical protein
MHRLVIALTTLLTLTGGGVVAGYLLLFSASTDRAASFVPADSVAYVNLYLQPSAGQQMNLNSVLRRFPGFRDDATLGDKIDEAVQRFMADAGIDYRGDVKPWLGDQVALAVRGHPADPAASSVLFVAAVKDVPAAESALTRLASNASPTTETYGGATLHLAADGAAYAIVDEMLLAGPSADEVRAAIDTNAGGAALGDEPAFGDAMATLPADHLASVYLDVERAAALGGAAAGAVEGFSVASAALLAEPNGLRLVGSAPFDDRTAGVDARASFALSSEPSSLTDWMAAGTQASAVIFGLADILASMEAAAASTPEVSQALTQLRALSAFGLGIDVDGDLLPLLDREVALGLTGLSEMPNGILVLRPSDPEAAAEVLERIAGSLETRGSVRTEETAAGETITSLAIPQLGSLSYAVAQEIVLLALTPDDIVAALEAHEGGATLAASALYQSTFELAGERAGNELFVDVASLLGPVGDLVGLPEETRAILEPIRTFGISVPAREDRIEFNAMVTVE